MLDPALIRPLVPVVSFILEKLLEVSREVHTYAPSQSANVTMWILRSCVLFLILMVCVCGSLPHWGERYPIGAYHGSSNAHWVMRHLVTTSEKHIKMQSSDVAATVTVTLTSRQQHSGESTPPAIAGIHQASHCSRSSLATPLPLALASRRYNSITWLPTQRRLAGWQSPGH
jgi:hypothetical protein